jgi:hypothetical protein
MAGPLESHYTSTCLLARIAMKFRLPPIQNYDDSALFFKRMVDGTVRFSHSYDGVPILVSLQLTDENSLQEEAVTG